MDLHRDESDLTRGEWAADTLRNGMGSWAFVFRCAALPCHRDARQQCFGSRFDPYPFILLNLALSCLAALRRAILLIAAKRSDQISAKLAMHDYETNREALADIKEIRVMEDEIRRLRELIENGQSHG
ncbi:DUF1003 domain-containing protein [Euzebya tangerina]|uniref:DUF1003 domain-containing protein n=1 Tax=Euzebya tangerina TaxID=591198 RepID=UPI000E31A9F4|nr:DUF1003 domain-containing protein [Euzebya tangerina]